MEDPRVLKYLPSKKYGVLFVGFLSFFPLRIPNKIAFYQWDILLIENLTLQLIFFVVNRATGL